MSSTHQGNPCRRKPAIAAGLFAIVMSAGCGAYNDVLTEPAPTARYREVTAALRVEEPLQEIRPEATRTMPRMTIATLLVPKGTPTPDKPKSDTDRAMSQLREKEYDQALDAATKLIQKDPADPAGYNLQGAAYIGKKDLSKARKSFQKALSVRPDDVPSLMNLAQLDVQERDTTSARKRYQAVLAKDPRYVPALIGMANVELVSGNDKESLTWLEKAKAANPEALAPRLALATLYLRSKKSNSAVAELTEAQRFHPDNVELLYLLGRAQTADRHVADAIATYKKLVSMSPASPTAYYGLAIAQVTNQNFSEAAESLRKAVKLKPDYVDAVDALAGLEVRAGQPDEALKLARDLQRATPTSPAGLALEGDLLMTQKRHAEAAKAYQAAFTLQQTGLLAVKLHAAQTRAGNAKDADAKLQQWLTDHPDDIDAWQYSAGVNLQAGNNKLAVDQYQRVLQKRPNNLAVLNNLAILYQRENDPRALTAAEQAFALMPDSSTVADTLGWILIEQGKIERGLALVKKAAARSAANTEIRYHLAVGLAKSGDKVKARKELESLLAGGQTFPQREAAQALLRQL